MILGNIVVFVLYQLKDGRLTHPKIPIGKNYSVLKVQGLGSKNRNENTEVTKLKRIWNPLKMNYKNERVLVLSNRKGGDAKCS